MEFFSKKFFYLRTPLRDFIALSCYAKNTSDFNVFGTLFAVCLAAAGTAALLKFSPAIFILRSEMKADITGFLGSCHSFSPRHGRGFTVFLCHFADKNA
jgi:hypothetical protein